MPELPEVEIARRNLARWMAGRTIRRVAAGRTRVLSPRSPAAFARAVSGAKVGEVERRGKNLLLPIAKGRRRLALRMHLGMTGKFLRRRKADAAPRFSRVAFEMSDGRIVHYCDMRLFGVVSVGPVRELRERAFGGLGPDPLADGLTGKTLGERLSRTKRELKVALMDQAVVAGLGNIQAAEALWRAKLSPFRRADRLSEAEAERLAKAIVDGARWTIGREEKPEEMVYLEEGADNPFFVYDRGGGRCRRCQATIRKKTQGGRTSYWCPRCQRSGGKR